MNSLTNLVMAYRAAVKSYRRYGGDPTELRRLAVEMASLRSCALTRWDLEDAINRVDSEESEKLGPVRHHTNLSTVWKSRSHYRKLTAKQYAALVGCTKSGRDGIQDVDMCLGGTHYPHWTPAAKRDGSGRFATKEKVNETAA